MPPGDWAELVRALAWPIVALLLAAYFGDAVKGFLSNLGRVTLSAGGVDVTATRRGEMKAAALMGTAAARKPSPDGEGTTDAESADDIAAELERAGALAGVAVLWADDEPANNVVEREALRALGARATVSRSTDDALAKLDAGGYDLLVTDMARAGDERAGYTLIERAREAGHDVPAVLYTPREVDPGTARRKGAVGVADSPTALLSTIVRVAGGDDARQR